MKKRLKLLASFLITISFLIPVSFVSAGTPIEAGLDKVDENIILSNTNPIVMAVRIINIFLMFLGIIAVSLVIYGGFVWMTSNGNEDKIKTAKKILKNALIGLIIILSSWGIAAFILRQLTGSGSPSGINSSSKQSQNYQIGLGAVGACVVENFYPNAEKSNVPRNSSIMITFKEEILSESICRNASEPCACSDQCNQLNPNAIQIFKKDVGNSCGDSGCNNNNTNLTNATVGLSYDKKTIVILPKEYLGEANTSVSYIVRLTSEVKNLQNENIFSRCQPAYLEWGFSVNGLIDLVPPIVLKNGVFPPTDNEQDVYQTIEGKSAVGKIKILRTLGPARSASFAVKNIGDSENIDKNSFTMSANYQEISSSTSDVFSIAVDPSGSVFILSNKNKSIGAGQPIKQGSENFIDFPNFFSFKIREVKSGNSWEVTVNKPYPADQIVVAGEIISFPSTLSVDAATKKIVDSLASSGIFSSASSTNSVITITAKPGAQNNLSIYSARADAVSIIPFAGGENGSEALSPRGNPDQPMNSAIQINFSKELNPLSVTGPADYVSSTIQVVNFDSTKANSGSSCSQNDDCLSYNCGVDNKCIGNFVKGNFTLSSDYKTLEFLSDNECGVNGCGEKIYCLPRKSELKVILIAANLEGCVSDGDCSIKNPFNKCKTLPYTLLNNEPLYACGTGSENTKFYPAADVLSFKGIVDASGNSFDGNRDTYADGPQSIFNENTSNSIGKDNFQWSFFISDKIISSAPTITSISPTNDTSGADLNTPVSLSFDRLMLNSSLITGAKTIDNGKGDITHKFINILSFGQPVGYWISSDNIPSDDGILKTNIKINHSVFSSASAFNAQTGSGVRDIYQNCFRPSGSITCSATASSPSCCFGSPTSNESGLDAAGNCR